MNSGIAHYRIYRFKAHNAIFQSVFTQYFKSSLNYELNITSLNRSFGNNTLFLLTRAKLFFKIFDCHGYFRAAERTIER